MVVTFAPASVAMSTPAHTSHGFSRYSLHKIHLALSNKPAALHQHL